MLYKNPGEWKNPYIPGAYVPGFCAPRVKCFTIQCSQGPTFTRSYVLMVPCTPRNLYSQCSTFQDPFVLKPHVPNALCCQGPKYPCPLCFQYPTFPDPYISRPQCSQNPISPNTMFPMSNVTKPLSTPGPCFQYPISMFPELYVPRPLCSHSSIFPGLLVPRNQYSQNPIFKDLCPMSPWPISLKSTMFPMPYVSQSFTVCSSSPAFTGSCVHRPL